jgi:hypothetical protein
MVVAAFQLIPQEDDGFYWNVATAVLALAAAGALLWRFFLPYLPARVRERFGVVPREDIRDVHAWIGGGLILGLTFAAFGIGYFVSDAGYFFIMLGVAFVYWFGVARPSRRHKRATPG